MNTTDKTVKSLQELPESFKTKIGQPNRVESTKQYDRFVFKRGNRPVRKRVISLIAAIEKHNQLAEYPILVSERNDGKLEIADGQHRFEAARALKVPIFFIRSRQQITIEQIAAANQLQKQWSMADWMESWAARGYEDYGKLKGFCENFRLPITVGMEVIGRSYGGNANDAFKSGKFKVENLAFGQLVAHTLGALRSHVPTSDLRLVRAIVKVLKIPEISIDRLVKKLVAHSGMFERQATWVKYVEMIEACYNKHVQTHERASIVFTVDQMERKKRSAKVSKSNLARSHKKAA
jgi:ParB/Sulfiredoxin domain